MTGIHLSALGNHLWQSTLFAALAALLAFALRKNRAQLRYALWLAASLKFLIPFSLLTRFGSQLEWRTAPAVVPPVTFAIEQVTQPFAALSPIASPSAPTAWPTLPSLFLAVWFLGSAVILYRWWSRWRSLRAVLRTAAPMSLQGPIPIVSAGSAIEPGIVGVFRPILLLPQGILERLTPAQFRAILVHEFCHARRRDNLTAAIHMLVEAAFWFHPLVWWIGARLIEERERACDEEVLASGGDPQAYAAGILTVCRFFLESPLPCASGVTGADLKKRIEEIMTIRVLARLTPARKLLLAAAAIAVVAGPIVTGIVNPPRTSAQSAEKLRFEVATIKPFQGGGSRGGLEVLPGGGLRMEGTNLRDLITFAYGVRPEQVTGGQSWMSSESYQLLAKPERSGPADNPKTTVAPGTLAWNRLQLRLQTLLEERFHLAIHKTAREQSGYALVPAKEGVKMTADPEGQTVPPGTVRNRGVINGRHGTMHMLATVLSQLVGRPVEDRSGLTGTYTYKLQYAPESDIPGRGGFPEAPSPDAPSDPAGPSVFTALQEQLGLKLEPAKVKVESIVIDRAERPTAN